MDIDIEARWSDFPDPVVTANIQRGKKPAERKVP